MKTSDVKQTRQVKPRIDVAKAGFSKQKILDQQTGLKVKVLCLTFVLERITAISFSFFLED